MKWHDLSGKKDPPCVLDPQLSLPRRSALRVARRPDPPTPRARSAARLCRTLRCRVLVLRACRALRRLRVPLRHRPLRKLRRLRERRRSNVRQQSAGRRAAHKPRKRDTIAILLDGERRPRGRLSRFRASFERAPFPHWGLARASLVSILPRSRTQPGWGC